jgi:hypothetical protein
MLAWCIPHAEDETFLEVIQTAKAFQMGNKTDKEGLWVEFGPGSLAGGEPGLVS